MKSGASSPSAGPVLEAVAGVRGLGGHAIGDREQEVHVGAQRWIRQRGGGRHRALHRALVGLGELVDEGPQIVAQHVEAGAADLWLAAQAIGVLHPFVIVPMGGADA